MAEIHRFHDRQSLAAGLAEHLALQVVARLKAGEVFSLVLAGGATPELTYRLFAAHLLESGQELSGLEFYWGDERCVPPDHERSNYGMARRSLLDPLGIEPRQSYRMDCLDDPVAAAAAYERRLRARFDGGELPRFDLVLLGLGADAHTASLFPGTPLLDESQRWVGAVMEAPAKDNRISLTPVAINGARQVVFLVQGEGKAEAVQRVMVGAHDPGNCPAQAIHPSKGQLRWFLDEAAAARI